MPMRPPTSLLESPSARVQLARHRYFDEGVPPTGLVSAAVFESWARCRRLHPDPLSRVDFEPVTKSRTHLALQKNGELRQAWLDELPNLEALLGATTCAAMLTDRTGVLIGATCAGRAHEALMPVATRLGVDLSEDAVGTTAPGVVARTGQPVRVLGGEHFFESVQAMHCAAAPIRDIGGRLAGVLDISSEGVPFGFNAAAIVGQYARALENRLLVAQSVDHLLVRFQLSPDLLDTAWEGLMGIDATGCLVWINGVGRGLLGLADAGEELPAPADTAGMIGIPLAQLASLPPTGATMLTLGNGLLVWARADVRLHDGRRRVVPSAVVPAVDAAASDRGSSPAASACTRPAPAATVVSAPCAVAASAISSPLPSTDTVMSSANDADAGTLWESERQRVVRTVRACEGNVSNAARLLGVSRGLIYRRLREHAAAGGTPGMSADGASVVVLKRNTSGPSR